MNKRGFYSSGGKSTDARISNSNADESLDNEDTQTISPPQTNGQRKKISDLKIDLNFIPSKNNRLKKTSNDKTVGSPSPGSKTPQPKIRGMYVSGKNVNK